MVVLGGASGLSSRVSQTTKMPVLEAAAEIGNAVAVEIDHGRTDIVAFDVLLRQQAHVLEEPFAVAGVDLAKEAGIGVVKLDVGALAPVDSRDAPVAGRTSGRVACGPT